MSTIVSIVIPTHDRLPLLKQAIGSVLEQTHTDLELIVVDDGSTDGTVAHLRGIADPRLRVIELSRSGNIAAIRNTGARHATGRYVCFLDSDDLWRPTKLEVQLALMTKSAARWSYTIFDHCDERGNMIPAAVGVRDPPSGDITRALIETVAPVVLSGIVVDRTLFEELGGFDEEESLRLREDYHFMVRLAIASATIAIPQSLVLIRVHTGRTTRELTGAEPFLLTAHVYDTLLRSVLKDGPLRRSARRRRAESLVEAGSSYLRSRSLRAAARCFLRSALSGATARQWLSAARRGLDASPSVRSGSGRTSRSAVDRSG